MKQRRKRAIQPLALVGIIFALMGSIYTVLGFGLLIGLREEDAWFIGLIFGGLGIVFLVLGGCFLLALGKRKRLEQELLENGRYVWAQVVECVPNLSISVNHRHPYRLLVQYGDLSGKTHIFKSADLPIYRDPGFIGKQVKVYYRDESFSRYYVDTEPLLQNYIEH